MSLFPRLVHIPLSLSSYIQYAIAFISDLVKKKFNDELWLLSSSVAAAAAAAVDVLLLFNK